MVLAAGRGERMQPLTFAVPKPALPVLGPSLLRCALEPLARAGVARAVVNLHHRPEVLRDVVESERPPGLAVELVHEPEILGTAGGIRNAARWLRGDGPILVRNADVLADVSVARLLDAHRRSGAAVTLVLGAERAGYSVVEVDEVGLVLSLAGRPAVAPHRVAGRHLFTGFQVIDPEVIDLIPPDRPSDTVRDVYRDLAARGRVGSVVDVGPWLELGTPEAYRQGCLGLLDLDDATRARLVPDADAVRTVEGALVAAGPGADFHAGVELRGRVALGAGCAVAEGSLVEESVLLPGARVGPGCTVRGSVVGGGATVPPGTTLTRVAAVEDRHAPDPLPAHTRRQGGLLVRDLSTT